MEFNLALYLVTDRDIIGNKDLYTLVKEAVNGGVTMVQLREKESSTAEFLKLALELKELLEPHKIPLIINDRVDIALASNADGVHIGQSDMPYKVARDLLGPDKIIGLSVESIEDVLAANELDVEYIGISPIFSTNTKLDIKEPFGIEGAREAVKLSKHRIVAIGGINKSNCREILDLGIEGVAVVSAILCAPDAKKAAEEIFEQLCIK